MSGRVLCEQFVSGSCSRANCSFLHLVNTAPYTWEHRGPDRVWRPMGNKEMEQVELLFCQNEMTSEALVKVKGSYVPVIVEFDKTLCQPGQQDGADFRFRRLSTRSYVESESEDFSAFTQWIWYWKSDNNTWVPFEPASLQLTLEVKYLAREEVFLFNVANQNYRLDFKAMVQQNVHYGTKRSVRRRPMFVSIKDARNRKLETSNYLMSLPKVSVNRPSHWSRKNYYRAFEKVEMSRGTDVFTAVTTAVRRTLDRSRWRVEMVYQIQSDVLWHNYCSMKQTMQLSEGSDTIIDERHLFHGTDTLEVVDNICTNNFDFRMCGKNATVFGRGAYFACKASYSHRYTSGETRYMFLARVLVGKYTLGKGEYTRPPPRSGHILYDSCVDDVSDPTIFVVFERNQCYPEYLVQYVEGSETENHTDMTLKGASKFKASNSPTQSCHPRSMTTAQQTWGISKAKTHQATSQTSSATLAKSSSQTLPSKRQLAPSEASTHPAKNVPQTLTTFSPQVKAKAQTPLNRTSPVKVQPTRVPTQQVNRLPQTTPATFIESKLSTRSMPKTLTSQSTSINVARPNLQQNALQKVSSRTTVAANSMQTRQSASKAVTQAAAMPSWQKEEEDDDDYDDDDDDDDDGLSCYRSYVYRRYYGQGSFSNPSPTRRSNPVSVRLLGDRSVRSSVTGSGQSHQQKSQSSPTFVYDYNSHEPEFKLSSLVQYQPSLSSRSRLSHPSFSTSSVSRTNQSYYHQESFWTGSDNIHHSDAEGSTRSCFAPREVEPAPPVALKTVIAILLILYFCYLYG